ncbi:MAG TPA: Gfo/Idh/MocA family oxidoreductase [Verrucomicrobiae bacterium]|jgi:predicted dehydrogenase
MNTQKSMYPELSRRNFIKTTSTLAAAASLAPGVFAAGDETLKLALIGCGGRGSGACDQALSTKGPLKLVAMADAFKDRLDSSYDSLKKAHDDRVDVPEENKFIGFDAYQHAIALADVVILATPPGFRPMQFEEAVKQNKHIFMEKPVAVDGPGVRKVLAAAAEAKKKNLKVAVGLQRHHQKPYIETIKRLQDGAIGDMVDMRAYWNDSGVWVHPRKEVETMLGHAPTEMEYQMKNWYYFVWLCGDHIVEQHIHNLDVINWVKGAHPVSVRGMGGRQVLTGIDYGEIFDHHCNEYIYPDGSRLLSQCRHIPGCWTDVSEHVQGNKGKCDISRYKIEGDNAWSFSGDPGKNPYQQEHDDLFDAIRNDKPYCETADYGAYSTMTAIMGRMATYCGKEVTWDDALNSELNTFPNVLAWDAKTPTSPDAEGRYRIPVPGKTKSF